MKDRITRDGHGLSFSVQPHVVIACASPQGVVFVIGLCAVETSRREKKMVARVRK